MTREQFDFQIKSFLDRSPFVPFQVELQTGRRFDVKSCSVAFRDGVATYLGFLDSPRTMEHFDFQNVIQFVESLNTAVN